VPGCRVSVFGNDPSRKLFGATRRRHSVPLFRLRRRYAVAPAGGLDSGLGAALVSRAPAALLSLTLAGCTV